LRQIDFTGRAQSLPYGVHLDDWEVASSFSTIDDESVKTRSLCGTEDLAVRMGKSGSKDDGELFPLIDNVLFLLVPWTDFPNNLHGVDPNDWQFGPSFSTNRIVFAARAVVLV
jgi:hypothetical protein